MGILHNLPLHELGTGKDSYTRARAMPAYKFLCSTTNPNISVAHNSATQICRLAKF